MSANTISWLVYAVFATCALYFNWHEDLFAFDVRLGVVKLCVWLALLGFLAYGIYCSSRENLFRTVRKTGGLHWGRQIGADLYLGLPLALVLVHLNEGALAVALWALPTLAFTRIVAMVALLSFATVGIATTVSSLAAYCLTSMAGVPAPF